MTRPEVITLRIGSDNYGYLVVIGKKALAVDVTDATPFLIEITGRDLSLTMILSTHHHADHTAGNVALRQRTGCRVAAADRRTATCTDLLSDNQTIEIEDTPVSCLILPGHTARSCAFHFPDTGILFTGDTLFYAGCGRLFEGSAADMNHSLRRIAPLPSSTAIYTGHEYTLDNLAFAHAMEPSNSAIMQRRSTVMTSLKTNGTYGPSTIADELATNPFLRTDSPEIRKTLNMPDEDEVAVFAALRERKNRF